MLHPRRMLVGFAGSIAEDWFDSESSKRAEVMHCMQRAGAPTMRERAMQKGNLV